MKLINIFVVIFILISSVETLTAARYKRMKTSAKNIAF